MWSCLTVCIHLHRFVADTASVCQHVCSSETVVCVCVCFCKHIVHVSMCICVRVLLHVVTYACVFSLWDASVTGAELIVADGWRQEQTYILLCHTEEEEEEEEGDKNWGLFCAPLPPLSPLLIYLPCFSLLSPLHSLHFFPFWLVWHLTDIWPYSAHWEEVIEEVIEAKEGHEIKGTTSAEGYRKKTSQHRFVFQYIGITRRATML